MKKLLLIPFFLVCSFWSFAQKVSAPKYKKGSKVEVLYQGTWYKAEVLAVQDNKYRIHYEGYGADWDETVEHSRIRPFEDLLVKHPEEKKPVQEANRKQTGKTESTNHQKPVVYQAGNKVEVLYNGIWYKAIIIDAEEDKYKVHYEGYGDSYNEVVDYSKIRPTAETMEQFGRKMISFKKGDLVSVKHLSTKYEATILEVGNKKYKVHYENTKLDDAWVDSYKVDTVETGNTSAGPVPGKYVCYFPMYEHTYTGTFIIPAKGKYKYITGNQKSGTYQYNPATRKIIWQGGELGGKGVTGEYYNTKTNGPLITLIFPKGKREGDIQNCICKEQY